MQQYLCTINPQLKAKIAIKGKNSRASQTRLAECMVNFRALHGEITLPVVTTLMLGLANSELCIDPAIPVRVNKQ